MKVAFIRVFIIRSLIASNIGGIVGAIAVSKKEEDQIERLRKELGIASKSGLIRVALKTLERKAHEERLRRETQESVRRCAAADRVENRELFSAAIARHAGE